MPRIGAPASSAVSVQATVASESGSRCTRQRTSISESRTSAEPPSTVSSATVSSSRHDQRRPSGRGRSGVVWPDLIRSIGVVSRPSTSPQVDVHGLAQGRADQELLGHPVDGRAPDPLHGQQGIGHLGRRGDDVHEAHLGCRSHLGRDVAQLVLADGEARVGHDPLVAAVDPLGAAAHAAVRLRPRLDGRVEDPGQVGEVRLGRRHGAPPRAAGAGSWALTSRR